MKMSNYQLRKSQQEAIDKTIDYFFNSQESQPSFLWNCVMRWGKCLTSLNLIYQYNKNIKPPRMPITDVLILSFFPSTEDSWSRLFNGGIEEQENFKDFNFITVNSGKRKEGKVNIFFGSFQEIYTGKEKKQIFYKQHYQLLILDEYHYGSWNGKAKATLKQCSELTDADLSAKDKFEKDKDLHYSMKLSLSGTPYKSSIKDEFNNFFRFTYFDEQQDKLLNSNSDYKTCPQLELYSVSIQQDETTWKDRVDFLFKNTEIFNNGKLFLSNKNGASFWLVPSVKESDKIEEYINSNYSRFGFNIINLCHSKGNTLTWLNEQLKKHKDKRDIILSYNKLTLGVTVPEIENVVFLREVNTAELYMQAGCRGKSQYSDKSKDKAYLISFDLDNDFNIFQQITENDVSEETFIKLLPIHFIKYDPKTNISEISDINGKQSFLDALAKVPLHEQIRKTVSARCLGTNFTIPDDILEALNKISSIGDKHHASLKKDSLTADEKANIEARKNSSLKAIYKEGFTLGCKEKEVKPKPEIPEKYPEDIAKQSAFERGYIRGFNYTSDGGEIDTGDSPVTNDESVKRKESNSIIINKIQILIERFLYILIGDYYKENKFMDIKNIPAEFFAPLLGFDDKLFIRLYEEYIIDNDYINNMVSSFKSKENNNTNYLGLPEEDDYDFIDITELSPKELNQKSEESLDDFISSIGNLKLIDELENNIKDTDILSDKKFIYIATPSDFLLSLITCLNKLSEFLQEGSKMKNEVDSHIQYFSDLAKGLKIGETHRDPTIRCEELNGYTDKHILYDIKKENLFETTNEKSDTEFHNIIKAKGYKQIQAGSRIERFDISLEDAKHELDMYINDKTEDDLKREEARIALKALGKSDAEIDEILKK